MDADGRLARLEERQEILIGAMHGLVDVTEVVRDRLNEIMDWLQQPGSNETIQALDQMLDVLKLHGQLIETMPATIVQAMRAA